MNDTQTRNIFLLLFTLGVFQCFAISASLVIFTEQKVNVELTTEINTLRAENKELRADINYAIAEIQKNAKENEDLTIKLYEAERLLLKHTRAPF